MAVHHAAVITTRNGQLATRLHSRVIGRESDAEPAANIWKGDLRLLPCHKRVEVRQMPPELPLMEMKERPD